MYGRTCPQIVRLGFLGFFLGSLTGCPGLPRQAEPSLSVPVSAYPESQAVVFPAAEIQTASEVQYQVCRDLPDWRRPPIAVQREALSSNPRYGESLDDEPLAGLFEKFWNESVVVFATYGLSARVEPVYLSGVWTTADALEGCYGSSVTEAINQGQLAEMWLIDHQILEMTWRGDHYEVVVQRRAGGFQLIQFERAEADETLPVVVMTANGVEMTAASGDW